MAHNIKEHDHMLAVGERPWHGLGTTLVEPPASAAEALRIAKLDWTVSRQPMFLGNGRRVMVAGAVNKANEGQYASIVRDDLPEDHPEKILGVVGPAYTPYQNAQMGELFNPLIEDGLIDIETCGSLFNGRRVWILAKFRSENLTIEKGDEVRKYLTLAHGHDGTLAVRFGLTPIRIVCANTLSLSLNDKASRFVRCLHTTNIEQNLVMLRDAIKASEEVFELTAEKFRLLASRGVNRTDLREFARIIVDAPKDETEWTAQQRTKVGKIVGAAVEGRGNTGRNWWHGYNGFTEFLTWEAGRTKETRVNSNWFGPNADLNAKALDLALSMSA